MNKEQDAVKELKAIKQAYREYQSLMTAEQVKEREKRWKLYTNKPSPELELEDWKSLLRNNPITKEPGDSMARELKRLELLEMVNK